MVKIDCCDICFYVEKKMVEATKRIGFKGGEKVSSCADHSTLFKGMNREQFRTALSTIYSGNIPGSTQTNGGKA